MISSPSSLLAVVIILLVHLGRTGASAATENGFSEVREYSELWNFISARRWKDALKRLSSNPEEISILIVRREFGRRGGRIITKSLPLHQIFAVDVSENLGAVDNDRSYDAGAVMAPERVELIERLVREHPLAANVTDVNDRLPLHLAAYSSLPPPASVVSSILAAFPNATKARDDEGRLPLHSAVFAPISSYEVVKIILDAQPKAVRKRDADKSLPIHMASWGDAQRADSVRTFELLLSSFPESIHSKDSYGETPILIVCKYGRTSPEVARYLIERSGALSEILDDEGNTVLHNAFSMVGHQLTVDLIPLLIEAQPDLAQVKNKRGMLPLHSALWQCCTTSNVVLLLLDAYPDATEVRDNEGSLPLHYACREGVSDPGIVRTFLESNSESAETTTKEGRLPLHLALNAKPHLSRSGNKSGKTREGQSSSEPMDDVILQLVSAFPTSLETLDPKTGEMPLYTAVRTNKPPSIVQTMVQANPGAAAIVNEEDAGSTVFHLLAVNSDAYQEDGDLLAVFRSLLEAYPDGPSVTDQMGGLPLHAVCSEDPSKSRTKQELLDELLKAHPKGARVADMEGFLPLHHACSSRDADVVAKLLGVYPKGASVRNSWGALPIHIACSPPTMRPDESTDINDRIVSLLLDAYPQAASLTDNRGALPLHSACSAPNGFSAKAIASLVEANPEGARDGGGSGSLALHGAVQNMRDQSPSLSVEIIRVLLTAYPEAATIKDGRGNFPLQYALLYTDEHNVEDGGCLKIARMLYDVHPDAALASDTIKRMPIHHVVRIIGDPYSHNDKEWSSFALKMIWDYPNTLQERDGRGNLAFHILCQRLGESAVAFADRTGAFPTHVDKSMEGVIHLMLSMHPGSIDADDQFGLKPIEIVDRKRLLKMMRRSFGEGEEPHIQNEGLLSFLRRMLRRGTQYWKMMGDLKKIKWELAQSGGCQHIRSMLGTVELSVSNALNAAGIEEEIENEVEENVSSEDACSSDKGCKSCPRERARSEKLSNRLELLAQTLDASTSVSNTYKSSDTVQGPRVSPRTNLDEL